jgi:hypothetical protein
MRAVTIRFPAAQKRPAALKWPCKETADVPKSHFLEQAHPPLKEIKWKKKL